MRGNMVKKWAKIDHIPPHFYFGRIFPRTFRGCRCSFLQFSVYRLRLPRVGASRPGIGFFQGLYDTTVGGGYGLLRAEHAVGWGGVRPDARPAVAGGFACGPLPGDDAVDSSAWDHADICLPGIYFPCLPRSRARKHRARTQLPSYHPVDALVYGRGVVLQG